MSNRCPSCEKFVGLEAGDPEVSDFTVDDDTGEVSAEVRLFLACQDCGDEAKETTFQFTETPEGLEDHIKAHKDAGQDYSLSVDEPTFEAEDRYENKDRHGKTIKNYRYMKHLWGVRGMLTVTCSCDEVFSVDVSDEIQSSGMDELW